MSASVPFTVLSADLPTYSAQRPTTSTPFLQHYRKRELSRATKYLNRTKRKT